MVAKHRGALLPRARRRDWFVRLAKSPEQCETFPRWAAAEPPPEPFGDLRRADEVRAAEDKRIPPKIRRKLGEQLASSH
eukprot:2826026-Prymnesium_polylepis.1